MPNTDQQEGVETVLQRYGQNFGQAASLEEFMKLGQADFAWGDVKEVGQHAQSAYVKRQTAKYLGVLETSRKTSPRSKNRAEQRQLGAQAGTTGEDSDGEVYAYAATANYRAVKRATSETESTSTESASPS
jgi:hypothetical protein